MENWGKHKLYNIFTILLSDMHPIILIQCITYLIYDGMVYVHIIILSGFSVHIRFKEGQNREVAANLLAQIKAQFKERFSDSIISRELSTSIQK